MSSADDPCHNDRKLNRHDKMAFTTAGRRQHQLPTTTLSIDDMSITRVASVKNIELFISANLVMWTHVQRTVSGCFVALRELYQICNFVSTVIFPSLVVTLVMSRLGYRDGMLISLPTHLVGRLQSVENTVA